MIVTHLNHFNADIAMYATMDSSAKQYFFQQDFDQCRRQPKSPWCNKDHIPTVKVTYNFVISLDSVSRADFHYISDWDQWHVIDRWDSHVEAVEQGYNWQDDCDGLTETTLEYAYRHGVPKDHMWRVYVNSKSNSDTPLQGDHMIGIIETDDNHMIVVGDTMRRAYNLKDIQWQILETSSVEEGIIWRLNFVARQGNRK